MHIRNILTILFIFSAFNIFANSDSTGVQNNKGKKIIIHRVEAKETYYSLGRKYNVDPNSIMDFNNSIPLQIGTVLNIPTDRPFITDNASQRIRPKNNPTFLRHKVRPNETLSEIAEKFDTSVKTIQQLNNMRGTTLRIGQQIKVRQNAPVYEAPVSRREEPQPAAEEAVKNENVPKLNPGRYGLREHTERGVATWIDDENVDASKLLVLHRTAPTGTVIKITNPMTEKSTFAKVVGKFTENENTKDIIIVLTKAVADLIGALDKRFQVSIDYGLNE